VKNQGTLSRARKGSRDHACLFGFDLPLRVILEYPSGTAQKEADNDDADECACRRVRDKPSIKLQEDDKGSHGDDCEATTPKDEKREHVRSSGYDKAEHHSDCGDQWRVLKVLLGKELMADEAACARPVIKEVMNPRKQATK
jgi:hypothetical protein